MHLICLLLSSDYVWWQIYWLAPTFSPLLFSQNWFFPDALLQKPPVLSQVKHQCWIDKIAWPGISSCIAFAPLLFTLFQDRSLLLSSWILHEVTGNFSYIAASFRTVLFRALLFRRRIGYFPGLSFAIWMRNGELHIFKKKCMHFSCLLSEQNDLSSDIIGQAQPLRKVLWKGQYYFLDLQLIVLSLQNYVCLDLPTLYLIVF